LKEPPPLDSFEAVLEAANRELSSADARLRLLSDRAAVLAAAIEQEQAQLHRFLEEFGLEQLIYDELAGPHDEGSGPLIDVEALRSAAQELADQSARSAALRGNLEAVLKLVQFGLEQLDPAQALHTVQDTADVRLQQAMYTAREDERSRLAREVHDGPAQVLANAIHAIDIAEQVGKRAPDQVSEELARVRLSLKEGVSEIRRFMFDLRPAMLQDHGIAPTLRRYVDDYNQVFGKRVVLTMDASLPALTPEQDLHVFRIVQEALQNIHKHAMTEEAAIGLSRHGLRLRLTITDRGRGFRPNGTVARPGMGAGLPGMRERAKLIGAEFAIESVPGAGTTLRLDLPLCQPTNPLSTGSLSGVEG
jgi:two-component system sensor histidine kinase DegS